MPASTDEKLQAQKDSLTDEGQRAVAELKEKVHALTCDIQKLRDDARQAAHTAGDLVHKAREDAHHLVHSAKIRVTDTAGTLTNNIHNKPVQSACIALAIGFFGALLYRR